MCFSGSGPTHFFRSWVRIGIGPTHLLRWIVYYCVCIQHDIDKSQISFIELCTTLRTNSGLRAIIADCGVLTHPHCYTDLCPYTLQGNRCKHKQTRLFEIIAWIIPAVENMSYVQNSYKHYCYAHQLTAVIVHRFPYPFIYFLLHSLYKKFWWNQHQSRFLLCSRNRFQFYNAQFHWFWQMDHALSSLANNYASRRLHCESYFVVVSYLTCQKRQYALYYGMCTLWRFL